MSTGILGKKIGMTRVYDSESGVVIPVTVIEAEPNLVMAVKPSPNSEERRVVLAAGKKSAKQLAKPQRVQYEKLGKGVRAKMKEFPTKGKEYQPGDEVTVSLFSVGQFVDVVGISKGKGFQGVVKRHGFAGQPMSHGSMMHRRTGAIGCRLTPGRVWKNQRMPGHMGSKKVTVQNLKVIQVREDDNCLLVRGAIPGANGSFVVVREAVKSKRSAKA